MKRIGLIGFGVIGSHIFRRAQEEKAFEIGFVFEVDRKKTGSIDPSLWPVSFDDFEKRPVQLVVETAVPEAVRELGPRIIKKTDFLIFSLTSLVDNNFRGEMERTAKKSRTKIYIPHGAILGLDGIHDGKRMLETVEITTTKNPKNISNLGLQMEDINEPVVVYEGPTRGICERFPRNVNVHASVALMGLGFDRTRSKIIADPNAKMMSHVIEVTGAGLRWKMQVESVPAGAGSVSGLYTPESAYQTAKRICLEDAGFQLA